MKNTEMQINDEQELISTATPPRGARRAMFAQNEVEVNFSSELLACCGQELRPFGRMMAAISVLAVVAVRNTRNKSQVRYKSGPWIGVDLDGTLAHDQGDKRDGKGLGEIGSPIKPMLNRLKKWIAEGKTVKIFTARASSPRQVVLIKKWLTIHGLPDLEVTNVKDLKMVNCGTTAVCRS